MTRVETFTSGFNGPLCLPLGLVSCMHRTDAEVFLTGRGQQRSGKEAFQMARLSKFAAKPTSGHIVATTDPTYC